VIDSGIGLKEEEQKKLFKLFGTIERTRSLNTKGIGLGLSISRNISEQFGGQVAVKSKPHVGSAFLASMVLKPSAEDQKRAVEDEELARQVE